MHPFRARLREAVAATLRDERVALLFSGGTDSLTVLWTLLDLGADVRCYTFRLERVISTDSKVAKIVARAWDVPLVEVAIPWQETSDLGQDVRRLVRKIGSGRKTHVECSWPFTWIAPAVEERQVWSGLNADDLWGSAKSVAIKYGKNPEGFAAARREKMNDPTASGRKFIAGLFADRGRVLCSPYWGSGVIDYLCGLSWKDLNSPKQKYPAILAFQEEFRRAPIWRRNDNLQCGSGVREYLGRLLDDPRINRVGARTAAALYKRFLEE